MKKFFKYILTHFVIQSSHPEKTHDKGLEIRWTFFNIAFVRPSFLVTPVIVMPLKNKGQDIPSYLCLDENGNYWFGWGKDRHFVFTSIDFCEVPYLKISGKYLNSILDNLKSDEWCLAKKENDNFRLTKQKGKISEAFKLPERTLTWEGK